MRTVDEVYKNIAQGIVNSIDDKWISAWISAEVLEDSAGTDGEFQSTKNGDVKYFEVSDEAFDDFEELHAITTEGGNNKWNRAKFSLTPDGNFSIDFKWDQALADEIAQLNKG